MMVWQTLVTFETNPARFLEEEIKAYIVGNPENCLKDIDGSPMFEEPLVGFADGDDPLFRDYKRIIGDFHLTPREALEKHLREDPGAKQPEIGGTSVICWILPIAKETRLANRRMTDGPSRHWNNVRWLGEELNDSLARHVVFLLEEKGYRDIQIYGAAQCSLNGRRLQPFVNSGVDLTEQTRTLGHRTWVVPLNEPLRQYFLPKEWFWPEN